MNIILINLCVETEYTRHGRIITSQLWVFLSCWLCVGNISLVVVAVGSVWCWLCMRRQYPNTHKHTHTVIDRCWRVHYFALYVTRGQRNTWRKPDAETMPMQKVGSDISLRRWVSIWVNCCCCHAQKWPCTACNVLHNQLMLTFLIANFLATMNFIYSFICPPINDLITTNTNWLYLWVISNCTWQPTGYNQSKWINCSVCGLW